MNRLSAFLLFVAVFVPAFADEKPFAKAPQVARDGDALTVSFVVSERTDVEVAVLDAKGNVVRHLAAGVLGGKNPPPPPLKEGLAQSVKWDGKDDHGVAAKNGPFQVRVRAGMSVRFGKMIGGSPYTGSIVSMPYRAPVNGLVVDGEGNLFVKMMSAIGSHGNSGMWPWHLRKFDKKGDYVRTLLPYPPSTPTEKASGFDVLSTPDGSLTPSLSTSLYPVFYSLGNEILPRLSDGQLVYVHTEQRRLNFLTLDGSNRVKSVPMWSSKTKLNCPNWLDIQVALSPDGKYAYYSNVAGVAYDGKKPDDVDPKWPQGRIYRQDLTKADSEPERFFDLTMPDYDKNKYWMPSAWDKKTATAGIDTDAKGNVLVCDLVNHQIVEISPEGKQLSATKVPWPDKVIVARKSNALFIVSRKVSRGFLPPATLSKITGRGNDAKTVVVMPLKGTIGGAYTLDESDKVPVLWLAGQESVNERDMGRLLRIEDRGETLVVTGDSFLNRDDKAITFVGYMDVDREAEYVYVTRSGDVVWRYQGETGEGGPLKIKAVDLAIGQGGLIYAWGITGSYSGPVARYTRDLKPAPLETLDKHTYGNLYGRAGRGSSVCGMDVDHKGRVYATFGSNDCHVRVYDEKGKLVDFKRKINISEGDKGEIPVMVSGVSGYGGSIRVDAAGNLYLLQTGLPKGHVAPRGFEKDEGYRTSVGTIWKFPPEGGEVNAPNGNFKGVQGAIGSYAGCGPVSRWNAVGSCACTKPRFDVDDYGRLYIPNGITYSVSIRDNADNEIVRFGGYGNYDCQGPGSKEAKPEIPLGWPVTAGASDRFVYVGDCLNHRVVRVDKRYASEVTLKVPNP